MVNLSQLVVTLKHEDMKPVLTTHKMVSAQSVPQIHSLCILWQLTKQKHCLLGVVTPSQVKWRPREHDASFLLPSNKACDGWHVLNAGVAWDKHCAVSVSNRVWLA